MKCAVWITLLSLWALEPADAAEPFDGFNARYSDCTNVFKNRVVHLEYMYYPSKWVYPQKYLGWKYINIMGLYWATPDDAKSYESSGTSKAKWVAHPHPDGQGLALESMAPGWQHYYGVLHSNEERLEYKSHIGDLSDDDSESSWRIHCTNECRPKNGEEDLFNECVLSQAGSFHYHSKHRELSRFTTDKHPEDWFRYRIYAPQTETHWEEVHKVDNCNPNNDPLPATYTAKSSVTITTRSSQKVSVGQTTNFGGTFKTLLNAALKVAAGTENPLTFQLSNTVTHEWTREDIRAETEERTRTIGSAGAKTKMIQPGKMWKVFQIAGKVGYWNIKSLSIKSCDCDCNEECSPQADNSCSPMTI